MNMHEPLAGEGLPAPFPTAYLNSNQSLFNVGTNRCRRSCFRFNVFFLTGEAQ